MKILTLISTLSILFLSSCVSHHARTGEVTVGGGFKRTAQQEVVEDDFVSPDAPWDYQGVLVKNSRSLLLRPSQLEAKGQLREATFAYQQAERDAAARNVEPGSIDDIQEEAFARRLGAMLKQGRGFDVLTEISGYVSDSNTSYDRLPPRISLLAAFAYASRDDFNQALAWFKLSANADPGRGPVYDVARSSAVKMVGSVSEQQFDSRMQRWSGDPFIGSLFSQEDNRRREGQQPTAGLDSKWFKSSTYTASAPVLAGAESGQSTEQVSVAPGQPLVIGVLLPLSGRFASHANRVKQGIELAAKDLDRDNNIKVIYSDTSGDANVAEEQYRYLSSEAGAAVVLGPLLFKTSKRVGEISREVGTPIISFTKRQGVPGLSRSMFRLGATSQDQVSELVDYAVSQLNLRSFAALYPAHAMGSEFVEAFRREVERRNGVVIAEGSYDETDPESMVSAVEALSVTTPEGIFLPDRLSAAVPILEKIQQTDLSDAVLLGQAQWDDPVAIRGFGALIEGAVYVTPFNSLSSSSSVYRFVRDYKEQFKTEPELLSAQAYDAAAFVINSILYNTSAADGGVLDALENSAAYPGITGSLSVGNEGEINRRMSVLRLKDGEVVEVMSGGVLIPTEQGDSQAGSLNRES